MTISELIAKLQAPLAEQDPSLTLRRGRYDDGTFGVLPATVLTLT